MKASLSTASKNHSGAVRIETSILMICLNAEGAATASVGAIFVALSSAWRVLVAATVTLSVA